MVKQQLTTNYNMDTNQKELMKLVLDSGVNIVNCGVCGDVLLHKLKQEEITCPHCSFTSEPCDFPDFIY
jgi:uncharacterized Zn finger protein (UPF0148 family)